MPPAVKVTYACRLPSVILIHWAMHSFCNVVSISSADNSGKDGAFPCPYQAKKGGLAFHNASHTSDGRWSVGAISQNHVVFSPLSHHSPNFGGISIYDHGFLIGSFR